MEAVVSKLHIQRDDGFVKVGNVKRYIPRDTNEALFHRSIAKYRKDLSIAVPISIHDRPKGA
jgi:hypothetical protein